MSQGNQMPKPKAVIAGGEGMEKEHREELERAVALAESFFESGTWSHEKFQSMVNDLQAGIMSGEMRKRLELEAIETEKLLRTYNFNQVKQKVFEVLTFGSVASSFPLTGAAGLVLGALFGVASGAHRIHGARLDQEMRRRGEKK